MKVAIKYGKINTTSGMSQAQLVDHQHVTSAIVVAQMTGPKRGSDVALFIDRGLSQFHRSSILIFSLREAQKPIAVEKEVRVRKVKMRTRTIVGWHRMLAEIIATSSVRL